MISYDAGEDNEISFRAGDWIVQIEALSEEWWQGTDKDGNSGMFPGERALNFSRNVIVFDTGVTAAYVQMQE
jgi:hypothetical protein